jgi:hypothetical protein
MFSLSCLPFHEDLSGGTGCSAGRAHLVISIDLAKQLLQVTDFCIGIDDFGFVRVPCIAVVAAIDDDKLVVVENLLG